MVRAHSLVRRLLWTLIGSLTVVALTLGAGGALLIERIVEDTSDRLLGASARSIAETLALEDGEVTMDLPPYALGMLENNARDNVYYSVHRGQELLTGYPDLPFNANWTGEVDRSTFRYETYAGVRIRVASEARRLPLIDDLIVVQVAETLDARRDLAERMLIGLAALEAVMIIVAALVVWPSLRTGLAPVTRLSSHINERRAAQGGFAPLPTSDVPEELGPLVDGFNLLLQRLESSVDGMRRFTADASHQMRTPLAILRTHLSVLRTHGAASSIGQSSLEDLDHGVRRLEGLLSGLLALARTESAQDETGEETDLNLVVQGVANDARDFAASRNVRILTRVQSEGARLRGEGLPVTEIARNLLDNAIRYNRPGGTVRVGVEASGEGASIYVEDDGPGVPAGRARQDL